MIGATPLRRHPPLIAIVRATLIALLFEARLGA
jgi:hypothetical protein